jgi:phosphoglycerate dehydrogenase-like enzyme
MPSSPPVLALSEAFVHAYAEEIHAAAPEAHIVSHRPDGVWSGDAGATTAVYLSSDMWRTPMAREVLRAMVDWPRLAWAHTSSAGVDHPSFAALLSRGVTVTNAAGVNGGVIAQHVLALMLAQARRLDRYRALQSERAWQRLDCEELAGATAFVIGLGGIGRPVARLSAAFGMRVVGMRRSPEPIPCVDTIVPPSALHAALAIADYVVLACPLTEATRHLIDERALGAMKPSAYLINVARGGVVQTAALEAALQEERIAGAALDVFDHEPLPADSRLWQIPNLTITPHTAGSSPHNAERNARFFLDNLRRFAGREPLINVVTEIE